MLKSLRLNLAKLCATLMLALPMLAINPHAHAHAATNATRASEFTLANGMHVVVIPDHRAPVITHITANAAVWLMSTYSWKAMATEK